MGQRKRLRKKRQIQWDAKHPPLPPNLIKCPRLFHPSCHFLHYITSLLCLYLQIRQKNSSLLPMLGFGVWSVSDLIPVGSPTASISVLSPLMVKLQWLHALSTYVHTHTRVHVCIRALPPVLVASPFWGELARLIPGITWLVAGCPSIRKPWQLKAGTTKWGPDHAVVGWPWRWKAMLCGTLDLYRWT